MPIRRNSGSSGRRKSVGERASQSQTEPVPLPPANSLLQELLMDLGLTETAKTLEEESRRRLQSFACPTTEHAKPSGNSTPPLSSGRAENKGINSNMKAVKAKWHNGKDGSGNAACVAGNTESEADKQLPPLPPDFSRMALFRSLMRRSNEGGDEATSVGALQELCHIGISPLRWGASRNAATTDGNGGEEKKHNSVGGLITLTPYLRKLFHVFLDVNGSEAEQGEEGSEATSEKILPLEWASFLEVFFAYVEVLWTQVHLVEAVSWADFTSQGWLRHRDTILERLSLMHEKLQRLLLHAHQVEINSDAFDHSNPCQGKNQQAPQLPAREGTKSDPSHSRAEAQDGAVSIKDIQGGIIALFCHGAPIFRKNIEEVSTWIISHCGHHNKGQDSYDFSEAKLNEPITCTESSPASSSEEKEDVEGGGSARKPWQRLMGVVRHAVLMGGEEVSESALNAAGNSSTSNPILRWAQMFLRIQLLAWVVGSLAELSDVLLQHSQMSTQRPSCKIEGDPQRKSNQACRRFPTVSASLGLWYQTCAAQILEFNDVNKRNCKDCTPVADKGQESGSVQRLPRSRRVKAAEKDENIGSTLVNALKRAAHEFLVGAPTWSAPLRLSLVGNELQHETSENLSNYKGIHGETHSPASGNRGRDINLDVLGALATGQPYHMRRTSTPRRVPLYFLLKRILRAPRTLLDLQNERVPMDIQLGSMENPVVHMRLANLQGNGGARKGLRNGGREGGTQSQGAVGEPVTVSTYEGEVAVSGEATLGPVDPLQSLSDGTGIGVDLPGAMEEPVAPASSSLPSFPVQFQALMDRVMHPTNETTQSEASASAASDEDGVSSTDYNLDRPTDVVLNEVQLVAVTPCGSLLALLTTKGRLVVFALRAAKHLAHTDIHEHVQDAFCERRVLDVALVKDSKEPYWYEQLESFLAFSPFGRFLLCSVQNAPPFVPEGNETNRSHHATTGKVFIYSLHCPDDGQSEPLDVVSPVFGGDEDHLYGAFQVHKTLITVARWLDPRFWQGTAPPRTCAADNDTPLWKREARRRLSALQCLSTGRDNLILRWSPADGSIIQSIATLPVFDILVSPLMQAFYTINQCGQLSMYDAWNERDIESAKDNVVIVSQRGLPVALSAMQSSAEIRDGSFTQNSAFPSQDGEMQDTFFVGTRRIGFDRRSLAGGGTENESAMLRMSRIVQESGLPAGSETTGGNRLGRRIVHQVLRQEGDYLGSHTLAMMEPSSDSERGNEYQDNDSDDGEATGVYNSHRQGGADRNVNAEPNLLSFLRARHSKGEGKKAPTLRGGSQGYDDATVAGEAVLYRTGSRLVFEEVSQLLCHSVRLWPETQETRYAPPQQPYQLLSMEASGNPVWSDAEDASSLAGDEFIFHETPRAVSSAPSAPSYYTDLCNTRAKEGHHGNGYSINNASRRCHRGTGTSPQRIENLGGSCTVVNTHPQPKGNVVLSPVAKNGRYLCIMASVGPSRVSVPYERPLEYHAGIYACLVFDVLYGSVLRVIPVCPVLPRTMLTENGISHFHSHSKRAPIYMLPCAVTVVRHPHRRRSEAPPSSLSATRRGSCSPLEATPSLSCLRHAQEGDEEEAAMESNDENDHEHRNSVRGDDEDSMVLVAVGGLHSTTYVFDALTGARVKVVSLRKQADAKNALTSTQTRPPTKRARSSYVSLVGIGDFSGRSLRGESGANDNDEDVDDQDNQMDGASSTTSSEVISPRGEEQYGYQRQLLLSHLVERHGMDTLLKAATRLLRVVPLPFPPFCETPQEDGTRRPRDDPQGNGFAQRQSGVGAGGGGGGGGDSSSAASFSSSSVPFSTTMLPCPSFLGQLQLAAEGVSGANGFHSGASRCDGEGGVSGATPLHDMPFAHLAQRELRHILFLNETPVPVEENGLPSTGGVAGAALAVAATASMRIASKPQKRFRCGVVNSVAVFCDPVKGGVFVFSSDEYGGLFMAGGLLPPRG
ncbi:mitochondrial ATP-dependent zinc metallopeptidase [Trypanosoma conorhini]|uniref:Mitochondrial ATP-dependent zinc metallopeptidase n=1 Tax=Trypanosoma conorhini TaxID=83891 RepID=A0A3R7N5Y6_9TRYP|nr:mitochondrial ATP-dependent zinc metallopeptidase [Trypanosoma conorhini]RNF25940.1 mitochondrial ATP-dependent zinc metallopeptidase [Trypanosoma conorhini]